MLGALVASCATGVSIDDDVSLIPRSALIQNGGDPAAPGDGVEASTNDDELVPGSGEVSEGPDEELARGDQEGSGEQSSTPPADEEPGGDDSEGPPEDLPIVDTEPDPDEPDVDPDPITPPVPVPDIPEDDPDPPNPPGPTNPDPDPLPPLPDDIPPVVLPTIGHCLAGWEGSSCDVCSGQTQSDLLACRLHIDCYLLNECDPLSCGILDQTCGANRLGHGLAPKDIADTVYGCMCAP